MAIIFGEVNYVCGYLRSGHYELNLSEEQLKEFSDLTENEQKGWIIDRGEFVVDDIEIEDVGCITNIEIYND